MDLTGKVAIVTGAAGGIGKQIVARLSREGAHVVASDIDRIGLGRVVDDVNSVGGSASGVVADVSSSADVTEIVRASIEGFGKIDVLVNCAGLINRLVPFLETNESVWDRVIDVNLKGALRCSRAVLDHMIEQRSGRIVNIASIAGVVGLAGMADYSAAKGGMIAWTKAIAMEVAKTGVTVNCVSPGLIARQESDDPETSGTYLGRKGRPEEVAQLVTFLCSCETGFITGQNYIIDGGRVLGPKS